MEEASFTVLVRLVAGKGDPETVYEDVEASGKAEVLKL